MILRKLRTLRQLGPDRRRLLREAVMTLAYVRLWLALTPFQKAARRIGEVLPVTAELDGQEQEPTPEVRAVGWAVRLAADRVPFRAVCLQQAVAGKMMLRRRGLGGVIHFGVSPHSPDQKMKAHAWLSAGAARLTGYPVPPEYIEVARFR